MSIKTKLLKALADDTRLSILKELLNKKEVSCLELRSLFDLSQPTLSHHFHKLIEAGVIGERKSGTEHYYSLNSTKLKVSGIDITKLLKI